MSIILILLVIVLVGFGLWLIEKYVPMKSVFVRILEAVAVIAVVIWLLQVFGIWQMILSARV